MAFMKKVLIIDDDSESLTVISLILSASGFIVNSTRDGNGVYDKIDSFKPDLIFLDVHLGAEYDGRIICNELKANKKTKEVPVVLISASTHLDEVKKISNADDYISKPFGIDDLIDMAKRYTNLRA